MNLGLKEMSTVDVVIPFHRDDSYLCEAVRSALNSKNVKIRIIAIDNRLMNSPIPVCLKDPRIINVACAEPGYAAALNSSLPHLKSEFIAFLNSDDLHSPERLRIQIDSLCESESDVSICGIQKFSEKSQVKKKMGDIRVQEFYQQLLLLGFHYTNASWVIKRSVLPQGFHWRIDIDHTFADWMFFSDYLLKENIKVNFVNSPLYFQRVHAGQISKQVFSETDSSVMDRWMELANKIHLRPINTRIWKFLIIPWQLPPVGLKDAPAFIFTLANFRSRFLKLYESSFGYQEFKYYRRAVTSLLFRRALIGLMGKSLRKILRLTR